jgi:hypothetical protein
MDFSPFMNDFPPLIQPPFSLGISQPPLRTLEGRSFLQLATGWSVAQGRSCQSCNEHVLRKINQNLSSADLLLCRLGSSSLAAVSSATHKAETVLLDGQEYAWQRCHSWRCGDILLAGTRAMHIYWGMGLLTDANSAPWHRHKGMKNWKEKIRTRLSSTVTRVTKWRGIVDHALRAELWNQVASSIVVCCSP